MKTKGPLVFALHVVLGLLVTRTLSGQSTPPCESGWFGDNCQFQCHCVNGADCRPDGDCTCVEGWFGPQCQFVDLQWTRTCLRNGGDTVRTFQLVLGVWFTWMRIVTNTPGMFDRLTKIEFRSSDWSLLTPTQPLTRVYQNATVMDIHNGEKLSERVKTVQLTWDNSSILQYFCALHVSGGRNVAIKQKTQQSSTFNTAVASNAVDGDTTADFNQGSCTQTDVKESNWWTISIAPPAIVDRYRIFNTDSNRCRLRFLQLQAYNGASKIYFNNAGGQKNRRSHNIYITGVYQVTFVNISVSPVYYPKGESPCGSISPKTVLSLCEVQMFGDSVCPHGKWGRQCEKDCGNCKDDDACSVPTGSCLKGCAKGYYGYQCLKTCSQRCNDCEGVEGKCVACIPGYMGNSCDQECLPTFYGDGCRSRCTECTNMQCHHVEGYCTSCPVGKQTGLMDCEKDCAKGSYGLNCVQDCLSNCTYSDCNPVNGKCICPSGYTGDFCENTVANDDSDSNTHLIVVVVILEVLQVAVGVLGLLCYRRRKQLGNGKDPQGSQERVSEKAEQPEQPTTHENPTPSLPGSSIKEPQSTVDQDSYGSTDLDEYTIFSNTDYDTVKSSY